MAKPVHRLAVLVVYFNPVGYRRLRMNYQRTVNDLRWFNVPLFLAEAAYFDQDFPSPAGDGVYQVRASDRHILWQKERLLNLLVDRLPDEFDSVIWIDGDVLFCTNDWYDMTLEALQLAPVVQPFSKFIWTTKEGNLNDHRNPRVCVGRDGIVYRKDGQALPGGVMAARREVFPLYDRHILGGGDTMSMEAWLNTQQHGRRILERLNPEIRDHFFPWHDAARDKVQGRVECLPCDVIHLYHGTQANRRYWDRWQYLVQSRYDPARHVEVDPSTGLLQWTDAAPQSLIDGVREHFLLRQEDD